MYVNGRFLTQAVTGVQRFARETIRSYVELGLSANSEVLAPPAPITAEGIGDIALRRVGRHGGHRWEQLELPRAAEDGLLVNMCGTAPCLHHRQLVVLHDASIAAIPESYTLAFRTWYQLMIRCYAARARRIATVSKFSAEQITKYFGIDSKKIDIIPESGEHILRTAPDHGIHAKFGLEEDGYFMAVSSRAPHKNFARIAQAAALLPAGSAKFVVVGGRNSAVFGSSSMDSSSVIEVGFVTDGQLRALYEGARCLVYPSLYEGFGIPPLEAMACGCPVLVSRAASLPEVCGDAALYCDGQDPGDMASRLRTLLESSSAREEYREAGRAKSREWTWEKAARALSGIVKNLD